MAMLTFHATQAVEQGHMQHERQAARDIERMYDAREATKAGFPGSDWKVLGLRGGTKPRG